jgi:hypothetical protein
MESVNSKERSAVHVMSPPTPNALNHQGMRIETPMVYFPEME